jgi:hypothetical protein
MLLARRSDSYFEAALYNPHRARNAHILATVLPIPVPVAGAVEQGF